MYAYIPHVLYIIYMLYMSYYYLKVLFLYSGKEVICHHYDKEG